MTLQRIHYIQVILGAFGASLAGAVLKFPGAAQPWIAGAATMCTVIALTLGLVSQSITKPAAPPASGGTP